MGLAPALGGLYFGNCFYGFNAVVKNWYRFQLYMGLFSVENYIWNHQVVQVNGKAGTLAVMLSISLLKAVNGIALLPQERQRSACSIIHRQQSQHIHRNGKVVRVTALLYIGGDVKVCLYSLIEDQGSHPGDLSVQCNVNWKPSHLNANFVVTDDPGGCRHHDNLRRHQWRHSWHHDDNRFSVNHNSYMC